MLLIQGLLKEKRLPEARRESATLLRHEPPNLAAIQAWFERNFPATAEAGR
jgi:hypothetical protein